MKDCEGAEKEGYDIEQKIQERNGRKSGWKKTERTESAQKENPHTEHTQRQQHFCLLSWQ